MSGRRAKALRREEKVKQDEYLQRKDAAVKEMEEISKKYRIDFVPIVRFTPQGIIPLLAFVDRLADYQQKAPVDRLDAPARVAPPAPAEQQIVT